ncbi:MAG: murein hydrolase activator EnvC family protein [Armatimonadota bacterium]
MSKNSRTIRSVQEKLRQTKKKQHTASAQLAVAERRLQVTRSSLRDIQSQLHTTRRKLTVTQANLKKTSKKLDARSQLLSERLVDTYKHGTVTYIGVILGSEDFWDFLARGYVIKKIVQADTSLIQDIRDDKRQIESQKAVLAEQAMKRSRLELQHRSLTRVAYNVKIERGTILRGINNQRVQYESMLAALERDSNSIEAMLKRMERTPAGRRRLTKAWRGSFSAPVNGNITSGYGMRFHPILKRYKMHTGVDIGASAGSTIRAAGNGLVIYSGWYGAYGNTIIIDHGGGMTTLYGHCSSLQARTGQMVTKGNAIARVGSTGWSTGNHCHFEVRRHGKPVSPF